MRPQQVFPWSCFPNFIRFVGKDPLAFVLSHNLHRRHLDESQRAMVAARLAAFKQGGTGANQHQGAERSIDLSALKTQQEAAAALNVGEATVRRAKRVQRHGTEALNKAVEAGELTVEAAYKVAEHPKEEQAARVCTFPALP